jgi:arabinofuranosyltransferase
MLRLAVLAAALDPRGVSIPRSCVVTTPLLVREAAAEILARYGRALLHASPWLVLCALGVVILSRPAACLAGDRSSRRPAQVMRLVLVALALLWAWHLRWLCDDAFISLRYARNLARGLGLVYNVGERVEGYTNFLWTVLLAGAVRVHLDPAQVAIVLGLLLFALTILLTDRLVGMLAPAQSDRLMVSAAAVVVSAHYTFASFATSGLETMLGATLLVAMLERACARAPVTAGVLAAAATLCRPDHILLAAALGLALLSLPGRRREAVRFGLVGAALYLPYYLWRWSYYGDFFPNTYYAKAGHLWYPSQGSIYLLASFSAGGLWALLLVAASGAGQRRHDLLFRYLALALALYGGYLLKIGGDFMYGRLLCPLIPPLAVAASVAARDLLAAGRGRAALVASLGVLVAPVPMRIIPPVDCAWRLSDERTFYRLSSFSPITVDSEFWQMGSALYSHVVARGLRPKLALGPIGQVGYLTDLPILDYHGLTDRAVAHQPLTVRGRPGHERGATLAYLRDRGADLAIFPFYPHKLAERASAVTIEGIPFYLARYDPALLAALAGDPAVVVPDLPALVKELLSTYATRPAAQLGQDIDLLRQFYFSQVRDATGLADLERAFRQVASSGRSWLR